MEAVQEKTKVKDWLNAAVVVSALGYFVDIYDLILFSIVRIPSLKDLGLQGDELLHTGVHLLNMQMTGMLLGGIFWGVIGDKLGRIQVLFGSILLYSIANFANGFVQDVETYAVLRFVGGIGLAGELGAGITLVVESLKPQHRGYGTTIVAAFGICGAVLAAILADVFNWRTAYHIGGVLGLLLLFLRVRVFESTMFKKTKEEKKWRGSFLKIFTKWDRFERLALCVLMGVPLWFIIGILVTFAPEFAAALGVQGEISGGSCVMYAYIGLAVGDLGSGLLSQYLRSRRKSILTFLIVGTGIIGVYLNAYHVSATMFYFLTFCLGLAGGYWAMFVTVGAEQFGTNLRATVATSVPNFVRGSVVLLTTSFIYLKTPLGVLGSAAVVGSVCILIAIVATYYMRETFGVNLDYTEE